MTWLEFIELAKTFGPALGVYIICHYRDQAVMAKNKQRLAELEQKLMENKANVTKELLGLSSDDVINKLVNKS